MFNAMTIFWVGMLSVLLSSVVFYFESRSTIALVVFGAGFLLIGISILMGFAKMVSDK